MAPAVRDAPRVRMVAVLPRLTPCRRPDEEPGTASPINRSWVNPRRHRAVARP